MPEYLFFLFPVLPQREPENGGSLTGLLARRIVPG
jgi:hypothetical protein